MLAVHFKSVSTVLILSAISLALGACAKVDETMEATKSVPDLIKDTNSQVKKTNDGIKSTVDKIDSTTQEVKKTNTGLDGMRSAVERTNEGVSETRDEVRRTNGSLDSMVGEVRKTNAGIAKTNSAVHNQTLAVSLAEMMKPENTQYLFPPTGMLPSGQVFANEATADEIVQLIYTYMTEIETGTPDASGKDPATGAWKAETIERVDRSKKIKFTAAGVIAGLAPQETIDQIVHDQIELGGRYEATALQLLMMRATFISDLELQNALFNQPLSSPGLIKEATRLTESLQAITDLPYADRITVKTTGMLNPDDNYSFQLDSARTLVFWKKIRRAFDRDLLPKYKDASSPAAAEVAALKAKVLSRIPSALD